METMMIKQREQLVTEFGVLSRRALLAQRGASITVASLVQVAATRR